MQLAITATDLGWAAKYPEFFGRSKRIEALKIGSHILWNSKNRGLKGSFKEIVNGGVGTHRYCGAVVQKSTERPGPSKAKRDPVAKVNLDARVHYQRIILGD